MASTSNSARMDGWLVMASNMNRDRMFSDSDMSRMASDMNRIASDSDVNKMVSDSNTGKMANDNIWLRNSLSQLATMNRNWLVWN